MFAVSIFGVNSLVFVLVSYIYGNFSKKLDENKIGVQMLLTFLASYLHVGFMVLVSVMFTSRTDIGTTALIAGPVCTTVLSPYLIKIYNNWIGIVEKWSGRTNQV
jgi:cell shape-determining protein MreD